MPRILKDNEKFPIQPNQIDTKQRFMGAFDHMETEISARWIVQLCQQQNGWIPFTRQEIEDFYRAGGLRDGFTFNRLFGEYSTFSIATGTTWHHSRELVVLGDDGKYRVTDEFILKCYQSSPVVDTVAAS